MHEYYQIESEKAIESLRRHVAYVQEEMEKARDKGDAKGYASLMRLYLPAQKQFLTLCREVDKKENVDVLLAFANHKGA